MASVAEIAADCVALSNGGDLDGMGAKYWADNVVSLEPGEGPMARAEGIPALKAKAEWWYGAHDIHSIETGGPYIHGDQFGIRWTMDLTRKADGQRFQMDEIGVFTVRDGKIVEERYFYHG